MQWFLCLNHIKTKFSFKFPCFCSFFFAIWNLEHIFMFWIILLLQHRIGNICLNEVIWRNKLNFLLHLWDYFRCEVEEKVSIFRNASRITYFCLLFLFLLKRTTTNNNNKQHKKHLKSEIMFLNNKLISISKWRLWKWWANFYIVLKDV